MVEKSATKEILANALNGLNAHINPGNAVEDLTLETAGKEIKNSPYTIWQILKHINFWQERFISYIKDNVTPTSLSAKEGWAFPASPSNEEELQNEIKRFKLSLSEAINFKDSKLEKQAQKYKSGYDVLQAMASHISYHIGEIVLLRRMLGSWPPPSGGDTW
jgi:uncharacterized damage-inducible protein DinB